MVRSRSHSARREPTLPAPRYDDKAAARQAVWQALRDFKAARFPFPVEGRIPNFAGADAAAARLLEHRLFARAKRVKVNPDAPQRYVRKMLLERGITVLTPTPRLRGGFYLLDPSVIPSAHYWDAASLKMGGSFGEPVALADLPAVDVIVMGSVAVTPAGKRLGKGHGYADLEFAILRELGHAAVPVCTTVHTLQVLEDFPMQIHDVPVSLIATPDALMEPPAALAVPGGITWDLLSEQALDEMPVLRELKALAKKRDQ
ncbi:MAG: 5-formyltetrahydrofolate cyclo-ligase [Proteobacteria bacterium]|nr:MAG: 5-formyltetrahydrofolate cyclo-ligase [Pseudomonadota bacterium]